MLLSVGRKVLGFGEGDEDDVRALGEFCKPAAHGARVCCAWQSMNVAMKDQEQVAAPVLLDRPGPPIGPHRVDRGSRVAHGRAGRRTSWHRHQYRSLRGPAGTPCPSSRPVTVWRSPARLMAVRAPRELVARPERAQPGRTAQ